MTFRENAARKNHPDSEESFTARFAVIIRDHYGALTDPIKALARDAKVTLRTARNWWDGECAPRAESYMRLAALIPELRAQVAADLELDKELDRRAEEIFRRAMESYRQSRSDDAA